MQWGLAGSSDGSNCQSETHAVTGGAIDWKAALASRAQRMGASEIRELLKLLEQPGMVSFAGGIPDPKLLPAEAIRVASAEILGSASESAQALQYSASEGYAPLRQWIAGYMTQLGVGCETDNIVITSGSQQALDFLAKLFVSPGDTALVTAPSYMGALHAFNAYEPRYDRLEPERGNATPAVYADAARQAGGRAAMAYVVPDFGNPSGVTLSESARRSLIELTAELGIPLIEDAAYSPLRFDGDPVAPCLALDVMRRGHIDASHVVYCGTFSKTISPGLRVGWVCAARELVRKIVLAKQAGDLHSASLNQMIVHRVASREHEALLPRLRAAYAGRRNAMLDALSESMPPGVEWTKPNGGMFVWVTLPERCDAAELLRHALAEERIAFVPGRAFFANGGGSNCLRLSYSLLPEAVITEGVRRLGALVTRQLSA